VYIRDTDDKIGISDMLATKVAVQGSFRPLRRSPCDCLRHKLKTQIQDPSASDDTEQGLALAYSAVCIQGVMQAL
jgi:hypothetical protein